RSDIDLRLIVDDEFFPLEGAVEIRVGDFELRFFNGGGGPIRSEVCGEHLLQLRDGEWLLEVSDDGKAKGLSQLLRGFDDADIDAAHQDDAGLAVTLAEKAEDLDAVHFRHDEIKDN